MCVGGSGSRTWHPVVLGSGPPEGGLDRIWVSKNVVPYIGVHFFLCSFFIFWMYERFSQLSDILDLVPHSALLFSSGTSCVQILSRESSEVVTAS